jgi:hypothetical protein
VVLEVMRTACGWPSPKPPPQHLITAMDIAACLRPHLLPPLLPPLLHQQEAAARIESLEAERRAVLGRLGELEGKVTRLVEEEEALLRERGEGEAAPGGGGGR